jgi:hypothetical protein
LILFQGSDYTSQSDGAEDGHNSMGPVLSKETFMGLFYKRGALANVHMFSLSRMRISNSDVLFGFVMNDKMALLAGPQIPPGELEASSFSPHWRHHCISGVYKNKHRTISAQKSIRRYIVSPRFSFTMPPIVAELVGRKDRFLATHTLASTFKKNAEASIGPPRVLIISCVDPRVSPEKYFGLGPMEALFFSQHSRSSSFLLEGY